MIYLTVYRSLTRKILLLLAGLLLVLAAVDVVWLHEVSGPPETNEETGDITTRGRSQQRTDYLWGSVFLLVGGGMILVGGASLIWRRPVAQVRHDGLSLRIAGPRRTVDFPWSNVAWLHTGTDGEGEEIPPRVLLVHVVDATPYSPSPWGAAWDGNTLMMDADSWSVRPEEVVSHGRLAMDMWRRHAVPVDVSPEATEGDAI